MIFTPEQQAMEKFLHQRAEFDDFARRKFLYLPAPRDLGQFVRSDDATAEFLANAHDAAQQARFES